MIAPDEIHARVAKILVAALGADPADLVPAATLTGDLGAESIDFLDIVFRLEREFDIKVPRGELFVQALVEGDTQYVEDGRLTEDGLSVLRAAMPYANPDGLDRGRRLNSVTDLFTVDLLVRYCVWKLEGGGMAADRHKAELTAGG